MGFSASTFGAAKNLVDAITETGKIVIGSGDYQIDYSGNVDNAPVIERAMVALDAIGGGLIELPNKLIPITTFAIRKLIHIRGQGFNSGFINMVDSSATGMITVSFVCPASKPFGSIVTAEPTLRHPVTLAMLAGGVFRINPKPLFIEAPAALIL